MLRRTGGAEALEAAGIGQGLPLGDFDRLEAEGPKGRVVTQIQADRAVFVRSSLVLETAPTGTPRA